MSHFTVCNKDNYPILIVLSPNHSFMSDETTTPEVEPVVPTPDTEETCDTTDMSCCHADGTCKSSETTEAPAAE